MEGLVPCTSMSKQQTARRRHRHRSRAAAFDRRRPRGRPGARRLGPRPQPLDCPTTTASASSARPTTLRPSRTSAGRSGSRSSSSPATSATRPRRPGCVEEARRLGPVTGLVHVALRVGRQLDPDHGPRELGPPLRRQRPGDLAAHQGVRRAASGIRRSGRVGGRIVALTSDHTVHNLPYGASKGALDRIVTAAAVELADRGVRANVINPGPIDTGWMDDEIRASGDRGDARRPAGDAGATPPTWCGSCSRPRAPG